MKLASLCLLAGACATTAPVHAIRYRADSPLLRFDPRADTQLVRVDVARPFPRRRSAPDLPTTKALRYWWAGHDRLSALVELCVDRSGDTVYVQLVRSSGDRTYDAAIVHDVSRWRYEPSDDPADAAACEPATVTYML